MDDTTQSQIVEREIKTPNDGILDELVHPVKLAVRKSPLNGYGVFAREDIEEGEIVEEAVSVRTAYRNKDLVYPEIRQMCYTYPCDCETCKYRGQNFLLSTGFIQVYNHDDDPDVRFEYLLIERIIRVIAMKRIPKDKEVFHNYGGTYKNFTPVKL